MRLSLQRKSLGISFEHGGQLGNRTLRTPLVQIRSALPQRPMKKRTVKSQAATVNASQAYTGFHGPVNPIIPCQSSRNSADRNPEALSCMEAGPRLARASHGVRSVDQGRNQAAGSQRQQAVCSPMVPDPTGCAHRLAASRCRRRPHARMRPWRQLPRKAAHPSQLAVFTPKLSKPAEIRVFWPLGGYIASLGSP